MMFDVPVDQVISIIPKVASNAWLGVLVTAAGFTYLRIYQRLALWFGYEPIHIDGPQVPFEKSVDIVLNPLETKISAFDHSSQATGICLQLALGGVTIVIAIVVELLGLFTVTGVAYASYFFVGDSFNLIAAYQNVVAFVVLLTLVFMSYGTRRINQKTKYR